MPTGAEPDHGWDRTGLGRTPGDGADRIGELEDCWAVGPTTGSAGLRGTCTAFDAATWRPWHVVDLTDRRRTEGVCPWVIGSAVVHRGLDHVTWGDGVTVTPASRNG